MGDDKAQKRKVQITSIITLFVFLLDIYLIIYVPTDYILATAAFVTLVFAIFTLNSWLKLKDIENMRREEQYADIMKAEKGTYVVTLDMLKDIDQKINFIGQKIMPLGKVGDANQRKIASMLDSIVEDQKKIAKITISRSKENADALMNSNDKLLVQMTAFRDMIENIQNQVNKQAETSSLGTTEFGEIKNELFNKIQEMTESIKKEVDEISENIELSNHSMENLVSVSKQQITESQIPKAIEEIPMSESIEEEPIAEEVAEAAAEEPIAEEMAEPAVEEPIAEEMAEAAAEEAMPEEMAEAAAEEAMPEEMAEAVVEEPVVEESQIMDMIPQEEPIPETIEVDGNDMISELLMEKKSLDEAITMEEPSIEKPVEETEIPDPNKPMSPEDIEALLASTATENTATESSAEKTEAPVAEEPPKPDPNKPMSPEDIAALIANTAAEDLPEETVKFEEEENPPMPDMSDPNKPMSPEDIAALIANM